MAETPSAPHDSLFKQLMSNKENAAAELRSALPAAAAALDRKRRLDPRA
jgi:predicted transposase YdaD